MSVAQYLLCLAILIAPIKILADEPVTIKLSSKGNDIAFDTDLLSIKVGEGVQISFNNSAHKDSAISHNIAILKPGSTDKVFAYFEKTGYSQEKIAKHEDVIAITPMLDPGQSMSVTVLAKDLPTPGDYPYVCLVPGHGDMLGMKGILRVEK